MSQDNRIGLAGLAATITDVAVLTGLIFLLKDVGVERWAAHSDLRSSLLAFVGYPALVIGLFALWMFVFFRLCRLFGAR